MYCVGSNGEPVQLQMAGQGYGEQRANGMQMHHGLGDVSEPENCACSLGFTLLLAGGLIN